MKISMYTVFALIIALGVAYLSIPEAKAWGFWAHKRINRIATFTLPPEMSAFYKQHIEYITEHAVDPDKRRYATVDEAPRHYIDIDHYGEYPFPDMPREWEAAVEKYSEDTLKAWGILPWHLERILDQLTWAFKRRDLKGILRISADLGHYVGDAHVPLHTTENYNGQLTNQVGIHGFWESRLPELFGDDYDYWTGKATYLDNPNEQIWTVILESHAALDSVLLFEKQLTEETDSDKKYCMEDRGVKTTQAYCEGFSGDYHDMLSGMVERRMRKAIISVGSFWFTAWVDAGQPDLLELGVYEATEEELQEQKELDKSFENGAIHGREHAH